MACRKADGKATLVRFVRDSQGGVSVDETGKKPGRGAYLCARHQCFDDARAGGKLAGALRTRMTDEDYDRLLVEFDEVVAKMDVSADIQ